MDKGTGGELRSGGETNRANSRSRRAPALDIGETRRADIPEPETPSRARQGTGGELRSGGETNRANSRSRRSTSARRRGALTSPSQRRRPARAARSAFDEVKDSGGGKRQRNLFLVSNHHRLTLSQRKTAFVHRCAVEIDGLCTDDETSPVLHSEAKYLRDWRSCCVLTDAETPPALHLGLRHVLLSA